MSKYDSLTEFLVSGIGDPLTLSLDQIGLVVGGLPKSAKQYKIWWQNDDPSHHHSKSWARAGFTARPDLRQGAVTFIPGAVAG
jgi:hypothetical protein